MITEHNVLARLVLIVLVSPKQRRSTTEPIRDDELWRLQSNDIVAEDLSLGFFQQFPGDVVVHILLRPGHPEDSSIPKIPEMSEIHVGLVENNDFTGLQPGTEFPRSAVIMV